MGKKKNKVNVEGYNKKNNEEQHQNKDKQKAQNKEEKKSDDESVDAGDNDKKSKTINVVFKVDLHCEGCASKVVKCVRGFRGVEALKCERDANKLTVTGDIDPVKLREKLEQKTHKKFELISPVPKKKNKDNAENGNDAGHKGGNEGKNEECKEKNKNNKQSKDKSSEEKQKSKEVPITTAVMKVHFHCEGCIQKIQKLVTKTAGYREMKLDRQKELLTVTGAMDMKALAECLKKHLKKDVEIVPAKKEGEKKEKGSGDGDGNRNSGGGEKGKGKGKSDGNENAENGGGGGGRGGGGEIEGNKMQVQFGYPYMHWPGPGHVGGPDQFQFHYYPYHVHAPQIFSDENPNACSVM